MPDEIENNNVEAVVALEKQARDLLSNEQFQTFMTQAKQLQEKIDEGWAAIRAGMEKANIKKIEGDWGYITIVEKIGSWEVDDLDKLPRKFYKKVLDSTKLSNILKLEGLDKLPAGVRPKYTRYIMKKIK